MKLGLRAWIAITTADRMITGLSDLLRRTLELGPTQEIPLAAELDLLRLYLDIQHARFGDRLRVDINVAADVREAAVPVLLLQPLVENAIRHGLAERLAAGRIAIDAARRAHRLIISVSNDDAAPAGSRDSGDDARRGGNGSNAANGANAERIGLGNTRSRLDALYGPDQPLDLVIPPGHGARVTLDIPFRLAPAAGPARS